MCDPACAWARANVQLHGSVQVLLDGPQSEEELGVWESGCHDAALIPTGWCREFAALWVELHGRRYRVYAVKCKPGPKPRRSGTFASVVRGTLRSTDMVLSKGPPTATSNTVLGQRRQFWSSRVPVPKTKQSEQFKRLTKTKALTAKYVASLRTGRSNPYVSGQLDPRKSLRVGAVASGPPRTVDSLRVVRATGPGGGMSTTLAAIVFMCHVKTSATLFANQHVQAFSG